MCVGGGGGGKFPQQGGGGKSETLLEGFFIGWWELKKEWFWQFKPFSKLKAASCEYWTSVTCVSQEYEIKTKMVQEQWLQLKIVFFRL